MTTNHVQQPPTAPILRRILTVRKFGVFSIVHSVMFTGLMVCAFILDKPQPATFLFGFTHGVMYMLMGAACIIAARLRIVSVTTAILIIVVGLFGPYFGVYEFLRTRRRPDDPPLAEVG